MDQVDALLAAHGQDLQIPWDFMQVRHRLGVFDQGEGVDRSLPVDFIAVLGSHDDRNAIRAAQVFFEVQQQTWQGEVLPRVVTTGWESGAARDLWGKSEAAHLADALRDAGVPSAVILQDHRARNLGENATHVAALLTAEGLRARHGVIACKDYIGLRALATFERQYPSPTPLFTVQSPGLTLERWLRSLNRVPAQYDMSTFVGDVARVISDPDGYLSDRVVNVPDRVKEAHRRLVAAGFVRNRALGADTRTTSPLPQWASKAVPQSLADHKISPDASSLPASRRERKRPGPGSGGGARPR